MKSEFTAEMQRPPRFSVTRRRTAPVAILVAVVTFVFTPLRNSGLRNFRGG